LDPDVRALCILIIVAATASEAKPAPRWIPPLERSCREDPSWDKLKTCIDRHEPGNKITVHSGEIRQVQTTSQQQYLFVRLGEMWRMVYMPGDANYELVGDASFQLGNKPARRIDLSHHIPMGNTGTFVERVSLICSASQAGCSAFVTACTVTDRGRAVETFRGELREVDGRLDLVGDRSHTLLTCRNR
jgi:hypothetical protein